MSSPASPSKILPEERAQMKKWVETWEETGPILERLRREELRNLDAYQALQTFLGPIDFTKEPFCPRPTSGLVQQQAWFKKLRR